ncbi:MAG TPA: hypothetical protein VL200_06615 [Lacunisphaera sp.]|jgi:hypothetical protein|nr:hypothetical protein [Lacunisphaera sp.]
MDRTLEPEWLDRLAPDQPAARSARRDLRRINSLLGNHRWIRRQFRALARPDEDALEIGAGDGTLARAGGWDALDLTPEPADWPGGARWHRADIRDFTGWDRYPVIIANLVLHHLDDLELSRLGRMLNRHARVLIACEPVRHPVFSWAFGLLCAGLGAHPVTRHDGRVSIRAGFARGELPRLLGLERDFHCREAATWRGTRHFVAVRR